MRRQQACCQDRGQPWAPGTGFLGTPYLLACWLIPGTAMSLIRLLLNTEYPHGILGRAWRYNHVGALEWRSDAWRPSMNSYNHYAYGAVADWIYRYAAGIDALPSDAGFHTIYLHPNFDGRLGSLDFRYQSSYGEIRSAWSIKGADVSWLVTIPPTPLRKCHCRQANGISSRSTEKL